MKAWSLVLSKEVSVTKEGDHYVDQDGNLWNDFELACLQEDTNWQQVRIQAAIAAMQGMLANPAHQEAQADSGEPFGYFYAMNAIMCADVLIEELQNKNNND